jgi:PhoH-like ATPase
MLRTILVDTNILLDSEKIIYKLAKEYDKILITLTVLKELDKHKYDPDLSYSARKAIRSIRDFKNEFPDKLIFNVTEEEISNNDKLIIDAALKYDSAIATKDISMSIIAEAKGLETKIYDVVLNNLYSPYIYVKVERIYEHNPTFSWARAYEGAEYNKLLRDLEKATDKEINKEAWFFLIVQAERDRPFVYANHPYTSILARIDDDPDYMEIVTEGKKIKAFDIFQNCAIFALKEAPHCLITGRWGSGKTLLSTAYALTASNKKVFITRPPIGISKKYDIGFLPGPKEDKLIEWLGGFTSALYYIYGNTKGQVVKDTSYDFVKETLFKQLFEVLQINSIQGLSLLDNDVMMVDEIQLADVNLLSMILSRPSETGKLILMGDLGQSYNIVKPSESGLLKLLRVLPHKSIAYVELQDSYRSDLLEVAELLQDKTIT